MKTKNYFLMLNFLLFLSFSFSSCDKKSDDPQSETSVLSDKSKDQALNFPDSWGYMYAQSIKMLDPKTLDNDSMSLYTDAAVIPTAFFLPSAASEKYSTIGAGNMQMNSKDLKVLVPGLYLGTVDINGIKYNSKSVWSATGSSLVPAFSDSLNEYVTLTGVNIPNWKSVSKDNAYTITLIGNTANADELYVELKVNGYSSSSDKYLAKSLTPGSLSCTFTSTDLKALSNANPTELGVTLRVFGYKYKKLSISGKAYYIVNETYFTHALYWTK